jgi:hypothetical protein
VPTLLRFYHLQASRPDPYNRSTHLFSERLLDAINAIDPDSQEFKKLVLATASEAPVAVSTYGGRPPKGKAIEIALQLVKENRMEAGPLVKALVASFNHPGCELQVINGLGEIGPAASAALPTLRRLKNNPAQPVREAAANAVRKIE